VIVFLTSATVVVYRFAEVRKTITTALWYHNGFVIWREPNPDLQFC